MRVTPIDVAPGGGVLDDALTSLPGHNDPDNGMYIPRIAIAYASYDRLEDALGKFGLGDTMISAMQEKLVPGSESFDLWENGRDPTDYDFVSQGTLDELVSDPLRLADYHVIFIPCSSDLFVDALTPENIANIREWTANGGRWYVADWSNEWLQMVFPEYQDLANWDGSEGSADNGSYDSLADVLDPGLLAWLNALPPALKDINPLNDEDHPDLFDLPQVLTVDNWSGIEAVLPVNVPDWMKRIGVDKPRLRINGSYKLVVEGTRLSGSGSPNGGDTFFPSLHMDQQPAFSVKGSIGRLINIEINSEEGFGTNLKEQWALVEAHITQAPGKPSVVPGSDPRPPYTGGVTAESFAIVADVDPLAQ
jgi:hypothetical protein